MTTKIASWDQAVAAVDDGSTVAFGGAVLRGKPVAAAAALVAAGRRDLRVVTLAGSIEVEALLAGGAVYSVAASYVGLGSHGAAPAYTAAVAAAAVEDVELTEWMLIGGLRAAVMGTPFLPTRAGLGSQVAEERRLRLVRDPYGGEELLAIPAILPDVAFVHAWRADADGNVQMPWPPDHLVDVDVLVARAARLLVVSVEEIVERDVVVATADWTRLFGFEVDFLVEAPGGARPGSMPPVYGEDEEWLSERRHRLGEALLEWYTPNVGGTT